LEGILAQLPPILANLETVTDQIAKPDGTVMSILDTSEPIYKDLVSVFDSISGVMNNLEKVSDFVPAQLPQIAVLISELNTTLKTADDLMNALINNPLFKGGVPQRKETGPGGASPRDLEF
jgi:phospholipid/cholesterol/gamma-HCH transport system substrate-binding protein